MRRWILCVLLLCLLLSACGQMDIEHGQDAMNATTAAPTVNTTTIPTAATTTGSNNTVNKPPSTFSINDEQKLALMRNAATDDAALEQFLAEDSSPLMRNREDVVAFLKLIDGLPNLAIQDAISYTIQYFPEDSTLDVWYFMDQDKANGRRYLFTYILNESEAQNTKQAVLRENSNCTEKGKVINGNSAVSVLVKEQTKVQTSLAKKTAVYWLDVDGWLVKATYTHDQELTETMTAESVFASVDLIEMFR